MMKNAGQMLESQGGTTMREKYPMSRGIMGQEVSWNPP